MHPSVGSFPGRPTHALHLNVIVGSLWSLLALVTAAHSQEASPAADKPDAKTSAPVVAELPALHAQFAKRLSGSTLAGHFTVDGRDAPPKQERYEIESVSKLPAGDLWLFKVRIRYGDHDVNVPLPLTVSWAGTTPVIVVDQLTIPGLGTFDARVVIADQRYAGTWQHGDVGGHLFGQVVPAGKGEAGGEEKPDATGVSP